MVVHRPLDNPLLEAELRRIRARFGNRLVGKRRIGSGIVRELAAGGAVGILLDQRPPPDQAVWAPFFGRPTPTHRVLGRLALATGAPIVPIWGLWDAPGRYTVRFGRPLWVSDLPEDLRSVEGVTAHCNRVIEAVIRERPQQWLWYHDRWRDAPPDPG